jgi:hypothetical protein
MPHNAIVVLLEAEAADRLRAALLKVEAPDDQLLRLGLS